MNESLFELLNAVKLVDVIITTSLFFVIGAIVIHQRKNIRNIFEQWRKKRNFEDTIIDSISGLKKNDEYLKSDIDDLRDTMERAREVSKDIRNEMYGDLKNISKDLKTVMTTIDKMQEKEAISKRVNIKEKIEKLYRECSQNKTCTDMQFETLKDLIDDYERHGGTNSFVHSVVLKEMYSWEIIKKIPDIDE